MRSVNLKNCGTVYGEISLNGKKINFDGENINSVRQEMYVWNSKNHKMKLLSDNILVTENSDNSEKMFASVEEFSKWLGKPKIISYLKIVDEIRKMGFEVIDHGPHYEIKNASEKIREIAVKLNEKFPQLVPHKTDFPFRDSGDGSEAYVLRHANFGNFEDFEIWENSEEKFGIPKTSALISNWFLENFDEQ